MQEQADDFETDEDSEATEEIIQRGKCVFAHHWDSGGPGAGAGSDRVYHWRGRFAVSSDSGTAGPFDTLEAALQSQSLLHFTEATTGIVSSMLSADEVAPMLQGEWDRRGVEINGEGWVRDRATGEVRRKGSRPEKRRIP